ncbi:hypothetical protein FQN49_007787, partial [Arthroderma sp. PD_2]
MHNDEKPARHHLESSSGELGSNDGLGSDNSNFTHDPDGVLALGYVPELKRNRSLLTLLAQTLAIAT